MSASPVLRLERFSYAFPGGADFVLREISLEVYAGQCHCLTGPSGCGKTTLLMAVRGLLPPGRQVGRLEIGTEAAKNGSVATGIDSISGTDISSPPNMEPDCGKA